MGTEIHQNIKEWIQRITTPSNSIGGFSVCPYAKNIDYEIIETSADNINPPPWFFDIIIYVLSSDYTEHELNIIAETYNKKYPTMVFLPDHKNRKTFINDAQTNNGKHNLILCQWRDELENARSKLKNTTYYQYWNKDYLAEILNT